MNNSFAELRKSVHLQQLLITYHKSWVYKAEKQENARVKKNRNRWENADWCNYFNEVKEITQKGQTYGGAGEVDSGEEGT